METVLFILAKTVEIFLAVLYLAMLLRVILSLFASEENWLLKLCYLITEPLITPVRYIMAKLNIGQSSPIDIPFLVTYLLLGLLQTFLPILS